MPSVTALFLLVNNLCLVKKILIVITDRYQDYDSLNLSQLRHRSVQVILLKIIIHRESLKRA